jgi:hypothetical protein
MGIRRTLHGCVLIVACALVLVPRLASTELRPLVLEMLDNLGAVNRIGRAVALEDFAQVEKSARDLATRADAMRDVDLAAVYLDPERDPQWDGFLTVQRVAAEQIIAAARSEDAMAVMAGTQRLVAGACIACHAGFRDPARMLSTQVHVMTGFLSAWHDINRGLTMNDYGLIAQSSRDLGTLSRFIATDEMIESAFGIGGSKSRRQFRGFLMEVTANASRIEESADREDLLAVLEATHAMWSDGCLGCHAKFRR